MSLPGPQQRMWDLVKGNMMNFGLLLVANVVFQMIYQLMVIVILIPLIFMISFGVVLAVWTGPLGIALIAVFVIGLILFLLVLNSIVQGWNVFLARKVLDIKKGRKIDLDELSRELGADWKHYVKKGIGITAFHLLFITPLMLMIMAPFIVLVLWLNLSHNPLGFLFIFVIQMVSSGISILVSPIIYYIIDVADLRIAQGESAWKGMFNGVRDVFRRKRLFGSYYITVSVTLFASMVLFPIAILIRFALPIGTKAFIVSNDQM